MTAETEANKIANDNLSVEITEKEGCFVSMRITVNPKATVAAYKKALKAINKEVSLPGFRKGKAPESILMKNYGKYVNNEWKELLLNTSFEEVTKLTDIYPLSRNAIKKASVENFSKEEGASVLLEFERYPFIPEIDYKKLKFKKTDPGEISDKEIEEAVLNIQKLFTKSEKVEDRPAKEGDTVKLDIEIIEEPQKKLCTNRAHLLDKTKIDSWIYEAAIGMSTGESKEVMSKVRQGATDKEKERFQPAQHRITVKTITQSVLPEIDANLAKKVGADSVEQLKENIRKKKEEEAEKSAKEDFHNHIVDVLIETHPFEMPKSILEAERESCLKNNIRELKLQRVTDAEIEMRQTELDMEALTEAKRKVAFFFVTQQIAENEKIEITQDQLHEEMLERSTELGIRKWEDKTPEEKEQIYSYLSSQILEEKVREILLDRSEKEQ